MADVLADSFMFAWLTFTDWRFWLAVVCGTVAVLVWTYDHPAAIPTDQQEGTKDA